MALINPAFAPTATFQRPAEDADGNKTPTALGANPVVVSLAREMVFIPRGLDRKAGDQFSFDGGQYTLAGRPRGNQPHPFTGDDFGWVAFDLVVGWTDVARGVQ